jgi:hypothetical protein
VQPGLSRQGNNTYWVWLRTRGLGEYWKLKQTHYTPRRQLGERRYSSYSFSTSALDGGECSASCLGRALAPGKGPPVPTGQEAGWTSESVWTQRLEEKSFCLCRGSSLDRTVVHPLVRHYTAWATRFTEFWRLRKIMWWGIPKFCILHLMLSRWSNQGRWDGRSI